jgi:hypothetical protein
LEPLMDEPEVGAYEIAYLCGGAERVAMVALIQLHGAERIKISTARHRVAVLLREAADPIEAAVLDAVPDVGKVRGRVVEEVARSAAVAELVTELRAGGLIARHRVPGRAGLTRRGRRLRKELQAAVPDGQRVAVLGIPGIEDARLRRIFETPDPPPGRTLVPKDPHKYPDFNQESAPADQWKQYGGGGDLGGGYNGY